MTRADLVDEISNLKFKISDLTPDAKVFTARNEIRTIFGLEEFHAKTPRTQRTERKKNEPITKRGFAFCGIGDPESFFQMLRRDGFEIAATKMFRDHHIYTQRDVAEIERRARNANAEILLTTAKDAVKLSNLKFEIDCLVVE